MFASTCAGTTAEDPLYAKHIPSTTAPPPSASASRHKASPMGSLLRFLFTGAWHHRVAASDVETGGPAFACTASAGPVAEADGSTSARRPSSGPAPQPETGNAIGQIQDHQAKGRAGAGTQSVLVLLKSKCSIKMPNVDTKDQHFSLQDFQLEIQHRDVTISKDETTNEEEAILVPWPAEDLAVHGSVTGVCMRDEWDAQPNFDRLPEPLELVWFPLDVQPLHVFAWKKIYPVLIEPVVVHVKQELTVNQNFEKSSEWTLVQTEIYSKWNKDDLQLEIMVVIVARRKPWFYVVNIGLPVLLIVIFSFLSFQFEPLQLSEKLQVTLTMVLTLVAFKLSVLSANYLPTLGYLTLLDWYMLFGFIIVALVALQNWLVFLLHLQHQQLDVASAWTLFAIWMLVNFICCIIALAALLSDGGGSARKARQYQDKWTEVEDLRDDASFLKKIHAKRCDEAKSMTLTINDMQAFDQQGSSTAQQNSDLTKIVDEKDFLGLAEQFNPPKWLTDINSNDQHLHNLKEYAKSLPQSKHEMFQKEAQRIPGIGPVKSALLLERVLERRKEYLDEFIMPWIWLYFGKPQKWVIDLDFEDKLELVKLAQEKNEEKFKKFATSLANIGEARAKNLFDAAMSEQESK